MWEEQDDQKVVELVQEVASFMATRAFASHYDDPETRTEREEEGLGIAVSKWTQWDGAKIMRVFFAALKDANFHTEAAAVGEMLEKL